MIAEDVRTGTKRQLLQGTSSDDNDACLSDRLYRRHEQVRCKIKRGARLISRLLAACLSAFLF